MASIPTVSDGSQPRQWSIINRTLIVSADSKRVLAVLNGGGPLLLPPGSVLQFGDPPGQFVVTKVRVMVGEDGGVVCIEAEPETGDCPLTAGHPGHFARRSGHLRPVPSQPPQWSRVRPGNG